MIALTHAWNLSREPFGAQLRRWLRAVDDPLLHGPLRTPFYERSRAELDVDPAAPQG